MGKGKICIIWLLCLSLLLPSGSTIVCASQETEAESVEVTRTSIQIEQYEEEADKIVKAADDDWLDLEKTGVCQAYAEAYKDLTENTFEREGYTFVGWNTKADGSGKSYTDKSKITNLTSKNGKTITLYAQWEKNEQLNFKVEVINNIIKSDNNLIIL